jgi:hypothetical protein
METLLVLLGIGWALLPFGLLFAHVAHRKASGERHDALAAELGRLSARVRELERRASSVAAGEAARAPAPEAVPAPSPYPEITLPTIPAPRTAGPVPPPSPVPAASAVPPRDVTPTPTPTPVTPPPRPAPTIPQVTPTPGVEWPRPPPPPPPPPRRAQFRNPLAGLTIDWERFVGVKLFSWLAGIAVVVAAISFVRYSVEHGLLSPPVRMAIGLLVGVSLLVGCETRRAQAYRVTAQALAAAGIATLFSTFWAAHALWHLLPATATFALLALVTAVAAVLSIRRDALFVALLGLVGGFATPALLATGEDRPIGLFSYLLLLNVGLAWIAHRKRWPLLSALSLGFTALYQAAWVARFLDETKLPIAIAVFLVFPLLGFVALGLARRGGRDAAEPRLFSWTAALGAVPPVLFAVWFSVSGAYGGHWALLLGFVAILGAGLAAVAAWQGPEWLHLAGAAAVLATVAGFLARAWTPDAWPGALALLVLLAAVYLAAPEVLERLGRGLRAEGRLAVYAAPFLLLAFPVLAALEPRAASAPLFFGPILLVAAGCAASAIRRGDGPVHLFAAAFAVAAEAAWSAYHLAPGRLLPALAAYAIFAGFFLAVPLLAERLGRPLRPAGSGALLLLASLGLLFFLAAGPVAELALGGIALLVALLEAGLLFEASRGRSPLAPLAAFAGLLLGFAVLAVWWVAAFTAALLLPALVAVGGLALVALGGSIRAARGRATGGEPDPVGLGAFVGLAGHLFLVAVVIRPELAHPAWPWLAVLGVLDLAFLVAALHRRHGALSAGALGGTVLVLAAPFALAANPAPATAVVAAWAALGAAALGLAGFLLAPRRAPGRERTFAVAAAIALFGGQAVVVLACAVPAQVPLPLDVGAQTALLAGLLFLAWRMPDERIGLAAAATAAACAALHRIAAPEDPAGLLWLAAPLYALPLAYPLLRLRRAPAERLPFAGAVVASAAFFLLARGAIVRLGGGAAIGLLPVAQALLLVPHLAVLVRSAPAEARDRGRLALVAGACLALVTVAIPLQLEKQWITIGWALEGAALAWLFRRIGHRGLLAWSAALYAAVLLRLALNPSVLEYQAKSATPIWNWYLYAYLAAAAAFFLGARLLRGGEDRLRPGWPRLGPMLAAGGTVLLFLLVNIEIADFHSAGPRIEFRFSAGLAQDLTYTIAWALFAIGVLVAGVVSTSRAARVAAIALLVVTVLKAFLHDLARLTGLYRVASFVGLAISLALVAIVLQRFVLGAGRRPGGEPPAPEVT